MGKYNIIYMKEVNNVEITERLVSIRNEHGYSKRTVSEMTGIPYTTYIKYESGERKDLSMVALCKLADFYGVTTDYLLGREPAVNPLAMLNISVKEISSDKFIETYEKLPETAKQIFIDTMLKLSEAAVSGNMEYLYYGWTADQLHAELDRQLKAEETAKEKSEVS